MVVAASGLEHAGAKQNDYALPVLLLLVIAVPECSYRGQRAVFRDASRSRLWPYWVVSFFAGGARFAAHLPLVRGIAQLLVH